MKSFPKIVRCVRCSFVPITGELWYWLWLNAFFLANNVCFSFFQQARSDITGCKMPTFSVISQSVSGISAERPFAVLYIQGGKRKLKRLSGCKAAYEDKIQSAGIWNVADKACRRRNVFFDEVWFIDMIVWTWHKSTGHLIMWIWRKTEDSEPNLM